MLGNIGSGRLGCAKDGFEALLALGTAPMELQVGASFAGEQALAVASALSRVAQTIAKMPATYTRYPNSDAQVFGLTRQRRGGAAATVLDLEMLRGWGLIEVPDHLSRAMSRFGSWIEPLLVAEWARITRTYAERMGLAIAPGASEAALAWIEPARTTSLGRDLARRLLDRGQCAKLVRGTSCREDRERFGGCQSDERRRSAAIVIISEGGATAI